LSTAHNVTSYRLKQAV